MVVIEKAVLLQSQNGREGARRVGMNLGEMIFETIGTKVADKYGRVFVPRVRKQ